MRCVCCGLEYFECEWCRNAFNPRRGQNRFCGSACATAAAQARPRALLGQFVERGAADDCWPWTGPYSDQGYPRLGWNGGTVQARRLVYESVYGALPPGRAVRMRCRNRACVNPAHLRVMPQLPLVVAERRSRAPLVRLPRLQSWREQRGLSRRQLAARAGCGHATIWRLELGYPAKPRTVQRLAEALECRVDDLW